MNVYQRGEQSNPRGSSGNAAMMTAWPWLVQISRYSDKKHFPILGVKLSCYKFGSILECLRALIGNELSGDVK